MDILLNDILNLDDINNTKVRFNQSNGISNPLQFFKENKQELLHWQFWNYKDKRSFFEGQTAIGFVKIVENKWLLFDISKITKDLNRLNAVGYEYEPIEEYQKYQGRIIIEFKNNGQQMIRKAQTVLNECKIVQVLEDTFDNDIFPGYDMINLSWFDLKRVLNKGVWKTALENQKGIYLVTDISNGKMYVGSAYGEHMIHGRWSQYIKNGHGGNKELKNKDFDYIRKNFRYSILDIYKSTIEDNVIINRESWWKNTLLTREFGYNKN